MAGLDEDELPRPDFYFKILFVGNSGCGKTALVKRFLYDSYDKGRDSRPVGVKHMDHLMVNLREPFSEEDMLAKLCVWDTENPHDVDAILKYKTKSNMIGVVYCYDIGNQDSFHDIDNWMRVVERAGVSSVRVLAGLKADRKPQKRLVLQSQGKELATAHGLRFTRTSTLPFPHFHECSAKTGENVESVVMGLVYRMVKMCMALPPTSAKYALAEVKTRDLGASIPPTPRETAWRRRQTRVRSPSPPRAVVPPVEVWPEGPVPAFCRDAARMTLEEYQWCLRVNHWDDDLQHMPEGHPSPPLLTPVWWWPGYGSRWGSVQLGNANPYGYVDQWFTRGRDVVRAPFKMFFGTLESEAAAEFTKASGGGPSSIVDALRLGSSSLDVGANASSGGSRAIADSATPTGTKTVSKALPPLPKAAKSAKK